MDHFPRISDSLIHSRSKQVPPYIISEYIASLPLHALSSGMFALILYFLTNMRTESLARNLFVFIGECVLVQLGTVGFALLAASLQVSCFVFSEKE